MNELKEALEYLKYGAPWEYGGPILAHIETQEKRIAELEAACLAFVEAYEKSGQLEKTDVAVRMARQALDI